MGRLENLAKLAARFRWLIEEADWSKLTIEFENFPTGCADACILLAEYLIDSGYDTPTYVSGELSVITMSDNIIQLFGDDVETTPLRSYAWLELDGVVVDITADGFDPNAPRVIVAENSVWDNQFSRFDEHPVAIDLYDDHTVSRLRPAYNEIIGGEYTKPEAL